MSSAIVQDAHNQSLENPQLFADDEPAGLDPELQTARFTEENALSARKHDLFSVLKQKKDAFIFEETWLLHVAEVDYTVPAGAKEDGAIQPALAVSEGAPNEKSVIEEMDKRTITARFEERNVLDPHDPTFDIVIQQNEIVTMKYGGLAFLALHTRSRRSLRFFLNCHEEWRAVFETDGKIDLQNNTLGRFDFL